MMQRCFIDYSIMVCLVILFCNAIMLFFFCYDVLCLIMLFFIITMLCLFLIMLFCLMAFCVLLYWYVMMQS